MVCTHPFSTEHVAFEKNKDTLQHKHNLNAIQGK